MYIRIENVDAIIDEREAVVDQKPVPIYEVECQECHSKIQYKKSEALLGSINCPVCGIPIWVDILADTNRPVKYEEV